MFLKGFKFGMLLQLAIGPICLFIFQTSITKGFFVAEIGVLGVACGDSIQMILAILGIEKFLQKNKSAFKIFSTIILFIFGINSILATLDIDILPTLNFLNPNSNQNIFIQSLFLTLSNPLTIVFWAGVFSSKITQEEISENSLKFFTLGCIFSTLFFLTIISILGNFTQTLFSNTIISILNISVGIFVILFGFKNLLSK